MGQYYKPINIDKKQFVYSHDFGNGLKLMEHSWIGNPFVGVVENLIADGGDWNGDRIVWAGDYADPDKGRKNNLFFIVDSDTKHKIKPSIATGKYRYVINNDTKQFVDKTKVPLSDIYVDKDGTEWPYAIHPLPILTCEGNGRGGGDLHQESDLVGKWARNRVTVANEVPEGYTELEFNVFEGDKPAKSKTCKAF